MVAYPVTTLPNTAHSVFYAYAIVLGSGEAVGSFEKFGATFSREHERIREILFAHGPITNEIVWGKTDIKISLSRVEVYRMSMLGAFNLGDLFTLEAFNQTVDILEYMFMPPASTLSSMPPGPIVGTAARLITYKDCVPTELGKDVSTETTRIVETMSLECRTVEGVNL